jgi:hypothetical protein
MDEDVVSIQDIFTFARKGIGAVWTRDRLVPAQPDPPRFMERLRVVRDRPSARDVRADAGGELGG